MLTNRSSEGLNNKGLLHSATHTVFVSR
jgi:hypothetical protein